MNTLLIVEDEKLIRQGLQAMVKRAPVRIETVLEARNGVEALEILRSRPVDVMLTDIRMPHMDGLTLIGKLKELKHPPLTVVISGISDFTYAVSVLRDGVRDYILKPFEREKIYELLAALDAEITRNERISSNQIKVGQQVLRSLLLDTGAGQGELDAVMEQYDGLLFPSPYAVLCTKKADGEPTLSSLVIREVGDTDVVISAWAHTQTLLETVLSGQCVGVSGQHRGLNELALAYREARAARQEAFVFGRVLPFSGFPAQGEGTPLQKLDVIVQLLGVSNGEEAKKTLNQLLLLTQKGQLSAADFISGMEQLAGKITAAYRPLLPEADFPLPLPFMQALAYDSAFEYCTAFGGWMDGFCEKLKKEFADYQNKEKITHAVRYLQKNFRRPLNMAMVSNEVSMNYSLFSSLFKLYTGTNFVGYLQNLRLQEGKRLLTETDMRIMEISLRIGFQSEKHFMKLFKAACGVSPSDYRRNARFTEPE